MEIIEFKDSKSPTTGFLSNESYFKFQLGGKVWKTVEHYFQAQKFVGTQHEENIRRARTVHQAKTMAKQRRLFSEEQGKIVKKKVYGKDKQYHIREDWDNIRKEVLREGIEAKFSQNPNLQKRLLDTGNARLKDLTNPDTGPILEEIRQRLRSRKENPKEKPKKNSKDVTLGYLTDQERKFVQAILGLTKRISEVEGWKGQLYPGMFEDAVCTLTKKKKHALRDYFLEGWSMKWNYVYTHMPKFSSLVLEIEEMLPVNLTYRKNIALALGTMVKETRSWDSPTKNSIERRVKGVLVNLEGTKLRFLKRKREYRRGAPPKIHKRLLTNKEKKYIEISLKETLKDSTGSFDFFRQTMKDMGMIEALKKDDFPSFIQEKFKKLGINLSPKEKKMLQKKGVFPKILRRKTKIPKELTIQEKSSGDIIVVGQPLNDPYERQKLLRLGGSHPKVKGQTDISKVRFPRYLKREVEDYIFLSLPSKKKWTLALKLWQANKYLTLFDTVVQIANLKEAQTITEEMVYFVLHKLYKCDTEITESPQGINKCVSQMMKSKYPELKIDPKALQVLVGYITTIKKKLHPVEDKVSRRDYLLRLDEMVGWGVSQKNIISVPDSLQTILGLLSDYLKLPKDQMLCKGALLVLLPPISVKSGANQYINGIIRDIRVQGIEKVSKQYEIPSADPCQFIINASTKYINSLMRKPELSWLSRRIQMMGCENCENRACSSRKQYTLQDLSEDKRALVYDEVLDPLGLSDDEYAKITERWEKLSQKDLLEVLNSGSIM